MKFFKYFTSKQMSAFGDKQDEKNSPQNTPEGAAEYQDEKEEVSSGTKIKIVAALLVVGFATYIAYWVQEPSQFRADVLSPGTETSATAETSVTTESSGFTQEVSIVDFSFQPPAVNVEKGTTVIWKNKDTVPHTVTGAPFSSGTLNAGDTFSHTFQQDGEFEYTCSFHPQMNGKVLAGQVPVETAETLAQATQPITLETTQELSPSALESTLEAVASPPEVTLPQDASVITFDPETLLSEAVPPSLEAETVTQQPAVLNAAAPKPTGAKLAKSGPEDFLYYAIFGIILYFNRKKLKLAGFLKK